jgi:hypothetical protein
LFGRELQETGQLLLGRKQKVQTHDSDVGARNHTNKKEHGGLSCPEKGKLE